MTAVSVGVDAFTPSTEYRTMRRSWELISDIIEGVEAVRKRSVRYLPKYQRESEPEYKRRLDAAPWRPEFTDALRSIASRPFGKDVRVKDGAPDAILGAIPAGGSKRAGGLADDIDGRNNNLTVFAREAFVSGIAKGLHGILIDYPTMQPNTSSAAEKEAGARPYWIQVPADNIIALYTEVVAGRETIAHVRIREDVVERDGFQDWVVQRVRVLEPGAWQLWEKKLDTGIVTLIDGGEYKRGRGDNNSVPLVLFFTGERLGEMVVRPPLADLAQMQIELFQALARQDEVLTFAGSPMLSANGMEAPGPDSDPITVGPKTVLFAPPGPEGQRPHWDFVQPSAANITEIRNHVESIVRDMRRLGMQPLTELPGNPTATGQAIDSAKAHSSVKAWALLLNDALEQAMRFTAEWMGLDDTIETEVSTDFSVLPYAQFPLATLTSARATGDLSRRTYWEGLKRFDVLAPDFDADAEEKILAKEPKPTAQEAVQVRV